MTGFRSGADETTTTRLPSALRDAAPGDGIPSLA